MVYNIPKNFTVMLQMAIDAGYTIVELEDSYQVTTPALQTGIGLGQPVPGPKGDTGPAGPQGIPGATGPTGPRGLTGADGATGPQGETGADGADGADGDVGTINTTTNTDLTGVLAGSGTKVRAATAADGDALPITGGTLLSKLSKQSNSSSNNNALGYEALHSNTSGVGNTAIGDRAIRSNTTGNSITAVGSGAMLNHSGGSSCSAVGYESMYQNTGLVSNGFGRESLRANTGTACNAFGNDVLKANTGANNTGMGHNALLNNTSGANNTVMGYKAGMYYNGTTGNATTVAQSTIIGSSASALANGDSNEIVVGYNAVGNGSNSATIGNTSVDTLKACQTNRTPASLSATGTKGEICFDENYMYRCVATNTWKKIPLVNNNGIYYVEKDSSGDFTTLVESINTVCEFMDCTIYVGAGTWDLISELGATYLDAVSTSQRGLVLKNRVRVICSSRALITCNYTGSRADTITWLSAFNSGEYGFTLENARIESSKCRYAIHDERDSDTDHYKNHYINCQIKHDNTAGGNNQCIGGGLGLDGHIIVNGCMFENPHVTNWGIVSWHNSVGSGKSFVEVKDSYFKGTNGLRLSWYGISTELTTAIVHGNSFGQAVVFEEETSDGSSPNENIELTEWNNIVRG